MSESHRWEMLHKRMIQMEEWAMHSEKMLETLHQSLCEAHRELEIHKRRSDRLALLLRRLQDRLEEGAEPEQEKPPHY
jgi:uncharacterized coiled-coil protein SlyX